MNQNQHSDIGALMHLYLDELEVKEGTEASEFLIKASAQALAQNGGRNWIPVIVTVIGEDKYQVVANTFVYAVAEAAGLERVWCIIADNQVSTVRSSRILAQEETPKINLTTATRDEIKLALEYVVKSLNVKAVDVTKATSRIDEDPKRSYWQDLKPLTKLRCGITQSKLSVFEQIFYLTPKPSEPLSPKDLSSSALESMKVSQLKALAKERSLKGYSKMGRDQLLALLSQGS